MQKNQRPFISFSSISFWKILGLTLFFSTVIFSQEPGANREKQKELTYEEMMKSEDYRTHLFEMIQKGVDLIQPELEDALKNVPLNVTQVLFYRTKIRWLSKNEFSIDDSRFLTSYTEKRIKNAFINTRRFTINSGKDLNQFSIKMNDSTLRVRNSYTEKELQEYSRQRSVQGFVNTELLVAEDAISIFVSIEDINFTVLWSKEFRSKPSLNIPLAIQEQLLDEFNPRKKTGLPLSYVTVSWAQIPGYVNGQSITDGLTGYLSLGYRYNEVATIFDPMSVFIDSKLMYTPSYAGVAFLFQPGIGYELYGSEEYGRQVVHFELSGGFVIGGSSFTSSLQAGIAFRLSRLIGLSANYLTIRNPEKPDANYPAGNGYIINLFFIL